MESTTETNDPTAKATSGIAEKVRSFVLSNFYAASPESLSDDASLLDQGLIDSTGVLEVVSFLEESFGCRIEDREMVPENFDSIARISRFVGEKTAG